MNTNFGLGILISARDQAGMVMNSIAGSMTGAAAAAANLNNQLMVSRAYFTAGSRMMGMGAAMLAPLAIGIQQASEFQYGLTEVNTLMDISTQRMDAMGSGLLDIMTKYGGNYREQTKGLYQVISSGVATMEDGTMSATKALDFLDVANKASVAGVTDTAMAVNGLTTMLNSYSLATEEAMNISDAMFIGVKRGKTTFAELAYAIGRVAPMAHTVGVSYTDLLATLTTATLQGIQTRESVTGMKQALQNIVRPSQDAREALASIGIEGGEQAITAAGGWVPFLTNLREHLLNADVQLSKIFTSVEGFNYLAAVTGAGWEDFLMILEDMDNRAGMTEQAFQKMSDTFKFAWMRFKANFIAGWIRFGYPVLNQMTKGFNVVVDLLEQFNKFLAENPRLSMALYRLLGVLGVLFVTVGAIITAFTLWNMGSLVLKVGLGELYGLAWKIGSRLSWLAVILYLLYEAYRTNFGGLKDALAPFLNNLITDLKNSADVLTAALDLFGMGVPLDLAKKLNAKGLLDDAVTLHDTLEGVRTFFIAFTATIDTYTVPVFKTLGWVLEKVYGLLQAMGGRILFPDIAKPKDLADQQQAFHEISISLAGIIGGLVWGVTMFKLLWWAGSGVVTIFRVLIAAGAYLVASLGYLFSYLITFITWVMGIPAWLAGELGVWGTAIANFILRIAEIAGAIWGWLEILGTVTGIAAGWWLVLIAVLVGGIIYVATHWDMWWSNIKFFFQDILASMEEKFYAWLDHLGIHVNAFGTDWGVTWEGLGTVVKTLLDDILQWWSDLFTGQLLLNSVKEFISNVENLFTDWNPFKNFGMRPENDWMGPNAPRHGYGATIGNAPGTPPLVGPLSPPETSRISPMGIPYNNYNIPEHASGGEFTKSGFYSGLFHRGEIVTTTDNTERLTSLAKKLTSVAGMNALEGNRQSVSFNEGAISLVVNVANGKDVNPDELADKLFDSIKAKMEELAVRTFRSGDGFSPGVSYG